MRYPIVVDWKGIILVRSKLIIRVDQASDGQEQRS